MQTALLYAATAIVFLALDAVMLKTVLRPVFERQIGNWLLDDIRFGPAIGFYLLYVAGIVVFAVLPAIAAGSWLQALGLGALLGLVAYGTYDFTNLSTLRNWPLGLSLIDVVWGTVLTGTAALAGYLVTTWLSPAA